MTCQLLSIFFGIIIGSIIAVYIYSVSIGIMFTPIGENILRLINGVRKLYTKREQEYLIPLFSDVYTEAKAVYPYLANDIEICIIDAMHINAVATGRKTVAVTRGAVDSLSEEELKGFIAHELGHIANGDTRAVLFMTVGNGIYSIFIIAIKKIINLLDILLYRIGWLWVIITIIKLIFYIMLFYLGYIAQIIIAINSRRNEYRADKFAYEIGFGNDLVEALYLLQGMCISDQSKLVNQLMASHPHIAKRIGTLEAMIDKEYTGTNF